MSVIDLPSATSKIIRPRRARPAEMVVARCHAWSVCRSSGVRRIVSAVFRPRAIARDLDVRRVGVRGGGGTYMDASKAAPASGAQRTTDGGTNRGALGA